ncbi:MAG: lyase family protein [Roseibium sp.]
MPVSLFNSPVFSGLYSDEELVRLLDDAADIEQMIRFERSLAKVQGDLGIIPKGSADQIEAALDTLNIAPEALASGTTSAGVPVPALVAELRKRIGEEAGSWVHWGATSQDVMDTATVLQVKACLAVLELRIAKLIDTLKSQSDQNADQLLAGRTRSQISTPITLGYRIAQWAHPLIDAESELSQLRRNVLKIQFGGASGINSAIAPDGSAISAALARELGLSDSPSWHSNRSSYLALGAWLQQVSAGLAKMAGDLILLGRSDIAEVSSGSGGGSSTMPQKANPVQAETILTLHQIALTANSAVATAAHPQEERDGAKWPLEWAFLPQMIIATGAALRQAQTLANTITPNPEQINATFKNNPEIMAETASFVLAKNGISRAQAKDLVAKAAISDDPFAIVLAAISPVDIDWSSALDPKTLIGPAKEMSARIFAKRMKPVGSR